MTAAAADPPWSRDEDLLSVWQKLDLPPGWRAEIIFDGTITVTPPPLPPHSWIDSLLNETILPEVPAGSTVAHELDIHVAATDKIYRPDLAVLPKSVLKAGLTAPWIDAAELLLAVEITSEDTADNDRLWKWQGYAAAGIPLYLLVDRWSRPAATKLFSAPEPADRKYQQAVTVPFGASIMLPEPFDIEVDSSEFQPAHKR